MNILTGRFRFVTTPQIQFFANSNIKQITIKCVINNPIKHFVVNFHTVTLLQFIFGWNSKILGDKIFQSIV